MRNRLRGLVAAMTIVAATNIHAQRPMNLELGAFGQYTIQDKELNIDNGPTIGGRLALYLFKNFAIEGDAQFGKADWNDNGSTKSLTLTPLAARLLYGIKMSDKTRLLLGAGYQQNQYDGRTRAPVSGFRAPNEYEDAVTALVGIRHCMNSKWNLRFDGVADYNPSPNFTGDATLNGKATNFGIRAGVGRMLRGDCMSSPTTWALTVTPSSSRHRVGESEQLNVSARDGKDKAIPLAKLKDYRCTSDNPNVATVDANARVQAVAPGTATITCGGMYAGTMQSGTHNITVRRPDWRLAVTGGGRFQVGQSTTVTAAATDEDNRPVTGALAWTSSNNSVASVDNGGNVRCLADGTVSITGTMTRADETRSGNVSVTCVAPPPPPPQAKLVVNLSDVHFAFDKAVLTKAGRDTLDWVIGQLNSAAGASMVISVEGHTDPYGSDAYNDRLSAARAKSVATYLTRPNGGVSANRIGGQSSFGERCLRLDDDHDKPAKSKPEHGVNRRVELWDLKGSPVPTSCRPASDYANR